MKADGKAHRMTVSGKNKIELDDILIGEVWIGSGQSNMDFPLVGARWQGGGRQRRSSADPAPARREGAGAAACQGHRLVEPQAGEEAAGRGRPDAPAWQTCSPQPRHSSRLLYFFGERLHKELDVPIGLIDDPGAARRIEPWTVFDGKGGGMYNGMIAPVKPLAIRGVIWYQGETNAFQTG